MRYFKPPAYQPLEKLTETAIVKRSDRKIIFCDEAHAYNGPLDALNILEGQNRFRY